MRTIHPVPTPADLAGSPPPARRRRRAPRRAGALVSTFAVLTLGLAVGLGGPTSASGASTKAAASSAGTLTAATPQGPNSFDPCANSGGASIPYDELLYAPLIFAVPSTNELVPGLASSWGFTGTTKLTFVVHLKPGYKFQDGTPVNAQAAMQSIDYCLSEKVQSLPTLKDMTVTGTSTLIFHLTAPTSSLPAELSQEIGMLISPAAIQKYGVKGLGEHPVGAGPYELGSYVPNSSVVFKAWSGYKVAGEPAAKQRQLEVEIITDQTSLSSALTSGTVDYAFGLTASIVPSLERDSNLHVHINHSALAVTAMFVNVNVAPMNNVDVRLALEYALDRSALSKAASDRVVDAPAYTVYPPGNPYYDPTMKNAWPYDVAKAKALLEKAGYPNGITINGALSIAAPPFEQDAIIAAQQWKKAGITVDFTQDQPSAALSQFAQPQGGPMLSVGWDGTVTPLATYFGLFGKTGLGNAAHVANPQIESALARLNSAYTTSGVMSLVKQMDSVIKSQALWIPLWYNPYPEIYSSHVRGALQASALINEPNLDYLSVGR